MSLGFLRVSIRAENPDTSLSNTSCQNSPHFPQGYESRLDSSPFTYLRRVVGWKACDLNYNNNRNKTDLSSFTLQPAQPACLAALPAVRPVNMEPSIECAHTGGRDSPPPQPSALPIFILTLWKTRRPSSSTAILFPRRGSYSLLDDYTKTVLHGGRLWPLQRADNPEVLHIYALWTAIVLRVLPAAVAAGLARRNRRAPDRAATAAAAAGSSGGVSGGVATCAAPPTQGNEG